MRMDATEDYRQVAAIQATADLALNPDAPVP